MKKIKSFLKQDSDVLRDVLLGLICLWLGISNVLYPVHRIYSKIFGLVLIVGSIFIIVRAIIDYKRKRKQT